MASQAPIPTVDLTAFTSPATHSDADRLAAGQAFVEVLHRYGFANVTGHGFTADEVNQAFQWNQRLFDLPYADKMKAPHPPGPFPHRGYSGIDHYAPADATNTSTPPDGKATRKISDLKESYEVGSVHDDQQLNIWLPDDTLPGFRAYATSLYERLAGVGSILLTAISLGLGLNPQEQDALQQLASNRYSQLRLLHYPSVSKARLQDDVLARLPAHNDWGTFTMLFQDDNGGLELQDPQTKEFMRAEPKEGALVLNVGDMMSRFTNDYFKSAVHRVSVPEVGVVDEEKGVPARRSIPFFVGPEPKHTVKTLPRFVSEENPGKYDPVRFDQYGELVSKYHYQVGNI
jgi:isopenicillin N synthase-like dioxygenase